MKSNPEGTMGDWSTTVGKSRSSIVSALHRLRAAGLAGSVSGKWRLVEPEAPPPKWVRPLTADREQRVHAHV